MKNSILTILFVAIAAIVTAQGTLEYTVTCNPPGFRVTYLNQFGGTEQRDVSGVNFYRAYEAKNGLFAYISAQSESKNAQITVEIRYQGRIIGTSNSSGDYVIASVSERTPDDGNRLILYPYDREFTGLQPVYTFAPILKHPDMVNDSVIGRAAESVTVIEKVNSHYYRVQSDTLTGYLWAGWFCR